MADLLISDNPIEDDRQLLDRIYDSAYEELRRLARSVRRGSPAITLSATTLVNEAWARLSGSPQVARVSRLHFKRIAARAMRQILVEAARRKNAGKRGGADLQQVTLDEDTSASLETSSEEVLALDAALEELTQLEPRQGQMVIYRFYGGLDVAETAELLEVSEATIHRDWRLAKAFLARAVRAPK